MSAGRDRSLGSERSAHSWALAYAALGWHVFPVVPGGKRPLYRNWQSDATTDPELIARYWRSEPGPNIGLICGQGFVAFDIEADHLPALRAWMREQGHRLPDTPIARTGRGGIHILLRARVCGHLLRLGDVHIGELKAAGGFIVACPSRTTGSYGWHRSPVDVGVAAAPEWLRGLAVAPRSAPPLATGRVLGPAQGEARLAALARTVRSAREGRRNSLLYWAMRRAMDDGIPASVAGSVLTRMARTAGLSDREIAATIRSASGAPSS
ncbi:hypothetical protein BH23CHL8_BH23CHL8_08240 [soil metagenome]